MRSKKALYNVGTNLVLQFIIIFYGFIVPKIIISFFGSTVNGLVSSITQFLGYITLLESGAGPVVKAALYKPIAKKDNGEIANILRASEKFFRIISYIFILYLLLVALFYPVIVINEFDYLFTFILVVIISVSIFAEYYFGMTYRLFLQASQKTYVISIIQIATYLLSALSIVIMVKIGVSIHILKLISGLIFVGRPLLQNLYVRKKYKIDYKNVDNNYKLKQKWDGLAQHIAAVVHNNTDITILTFLGTLVDVSIYSIYYLVLKGVKSLIQSFTGGIDALFGDMIAKGEQENLNKKFDMYEVVYFTIATLFYMCTLVLIVPFVTVYTKNVTDANYIRPLFGLLLTLSEFMWAIRLPYSSITLAAGHFKETRKGAWVEAVVNILLSIILVNKFGLIGVAIGTFVAMLIRTFEFVYHTNKYILKRSVFASIKKIILIVFQILLSMVIFRYISFLDNVSYFNWVINAVITFVISFAVVVSINCIFYIDQYKNLWYILKKSIKRKKA